MTKKEEEATNYGCLVLLAIGGIIWLLNYISGHPVWLLLPIAVAGFYGYRWYAKDQNAKRQRAIDLQIQLQQEIARKQELTRQQELQAEAARQRALLPTHCQRCGNEFINKSHVWQLPGQWQGKTICPECNSYLRRQNAKYGGGGF